MCICLFLHDISFIFQMYHSFIICTVEIHHVFLYLLIEMSDNESHTVPLCNVNGVYVIP